MIPEEKEVQGANDPTLEQIENNEQPESTQQDAVEDESEKLKKEVAELKDKYLRLYSEFENFRRRTSREKIEFFKTANEEMLTALLPVVDDFERAQKAFKETTEVTAISDGVSLIYNKLYKTLEGKGLKPMDSLGQPFNTELHEAITQSPAPSPDMKGKVIDVLEKGYFLNDKVVRFAKVIIGA
ncbi:MAG TPA: nucleotide exchange factor GrpE [Cytophagaceae bacterium]|jgi:molecular chaperone GrpE